jgi:hypothetical protein
MGPSLVGVRIAPARRQVGLGYAHAIGMKQMKPWYAVLLFTAFVVRPGVGYAAMSSPTPSLDPDARHSIGPGLSAGWNLDQAKWFWGWAVDYGYTLDSKWSPGLSLTYDQEIESPDGGPDKKTNTCTGIATISYSLTRNVAVATGIAKGFLDDDNSQQKYRFTSGDWSTGLILTLSWPWTPDRAMSFSTSYEWNISESEPSISFDLGLGLSF